jgi:hypothetical protein
MTQTNRPAPAKPATTEPVYVTDFNGVEVIRVKATDTKHELTIGRAAFETAPQAWTPVDKPALNGDGTHAAPKHHKDLSAK